MRAAKTPGNFTALALGEVRNSWGPISPLAAARMPRNLRKGQLVAAGCRKSRIIQPLDWSTHGAKTARAGGGAVRRILGTSGGSIAGIDVNGVEHEPRT